MKAMRKGTQRMLSADRIVELHDQLTRTWHVDEQPEPRDLNRTATENRDMEPGWLHSLTRHHRANFDLWHIEDEARTPGATDTALADVKRRIDTTNQLRNDLAEDLDHALVDWLAPQGLANPAAVLHSESPGLMIDRLSIQALKIYHTCEECERPGTAEGHSARNRDRLNILEEQRADLAACLDGL